MKIKTIKTTRYVSDEGFEFTHEPCEDTVTIEKTSEGFTARYLVQDEDARPPDEDGDDGLFLVGYHRDFSVDGPKHKSGYPLFSKQDVIDIATNGADLDVCEDVRLLNVKNALKKYHVFGLEAYIHSGVVLALSREGNFPDRQWDVSQLGAVFVAKSEWRAEDKARKAALGLIQTWNEYLSGEVYGIVKETYDKDKKQVSEDSCWGFSGYKYAKDALKTEI